VLAHPAGRVGLSALSGALLFLACADFDIWPLAWVGLLPLLLVILDRDGQPRVGRPFLYGLVCGIVANGGGFYWIVGLLQRFGHMPLIAAVPIFLLMVAYQALTFALFAAILCRLRTQVEVPVTWMAPLIFVACELCVPYVFPFYVAITQAWVRPVIQIADITGPLGVTFLLVLSSGALFDVISARLRAGRRPPIQALRPPLIAAGVIVACLGYGLVRIHQIEARRRAADQIQVGVVQANIGIHEKFVPGLAEQQLEVHQRLSADLARRGAELIVWPESSYPYALRRPVLSDFPEDDPRRIRRGFDTPLLFGALTVDVSGRTRVPYNTALMMDRSGRITGTFDKNFLLVFGEYIPYADRMGWLHELVPEMSNFARGTTTSVFPLDVPRLGRRYLGPMICYEDIIPAFARRLFDHQGHQPPPNLLVNITNDAWFGATSEPYEHLALAVFRAVEHRVDLVRAVNTGVSAFIDATGRVYEKGPSVDPQLTPGVPPTALLAPAALMTPGGLYQRLGETFGGVCLVMVLLMGALMRYRAGRPVRWSFLLAGAAALHGAVLVFALSASLLTGESVRLFYAALWHWGEHGFPEAAIFSAGWRLLLLLMCASVALGAMLAQQAARLRVPGAGRLEALLSIVCVTVLPVVLVGRMEGNTGTVVIVTLLCVAASWLGGRLARARNSSSVN
jgi:apolipoprotein N-acyltransferase